MFILKFWEDLCFLHMCDDEVMKLIVTNKQQNTECFMVACSKQIFLQTCPSCAVSQRQCFRCCCRRGSSSYLLRSPASPVGITDQNRAGSTAHTPWEYSVGILACGHPSLQHQQLSQNDSKRCYSSVFRSATSMNIND